MDKTNDALSIRFLTLLKTHVPRFSIRGKKATGLCPFRAENTPSFSADLERGVFYCFGCGKGGGVKDFALAVGEPWAEKTKSDSRATKANRLALECARTAYRAWERQKFNTLVEQYRQLEAERKVAEVAYRTISRRLDLYSPEEWSFWTQNLGVIYDRLAPLEHELDVFTFKALEADRFARWQEEQAGMGEEL